MSQLAAQIGSGGGACSATAAVAVACAAIPTCSISKPNHPKLNGVPSASGGDRTSARGSLYQTAFEVATSVEDGQPVSLTVDSSPIMLNVVASGAKASFPAVTLDPDGNHVVEATCTGKSGLLGKSAKVTFTVDSTPPDLTITAPVDGKHFNPTDDTDATASGLQFQVCGTTTSVDAASSTSANFCVAIGTATPACAPVSAPVSGVAKGCVNVTCPGGAPFALGATLKDAAGNPVTKTVNAVSCSSTLPSVQILDPVDGTGSDVTKHILAASSNQPRKDGDPGRAGAQYTVRACTDAAGGTAQLFTGLKGAALAPNGASITVVAAQAADGCPAGLGFLATFPAATLRESIENGDGTLATPTEVRVDVTNASLGVGSSPLVDVWVDTAAPSLEGSVPSPFCGKLFQSNTPVTVDFVLFPSMTPVTMTVTHGGAVTSYTGPAFTSPGQVAIPGVALGMGANEIASTITEPSGNRASLPVPCTMTVGNPPIVTWLAPTLATKLNASNDGDLSASGWQGTFPFVVHTDLGGGAETVQFAYELGGLRTNLGAPVPIDAAGDAQLDAPTLPSGDGMKLVATTSNVAGRGNGTAVLFPVDVDTTIPGAPTGFTATVADRRQVTFHLAWAAPNDAGKAVQSYDVRVSTTPIATQPEFDAAERVLYTGAAAAPGATDGIDVPNRYIENDYYFAVAARDKAGNVGPFVSTGPARAKFNTTTFLGTTNEGYGYSTDGSSDFNGDGYSDLVVGAIGGTKGYLYFGKATGYGPNPDVIFAGTVLEFAIAAKVLGDIDGDGLLDIGFGSDLEQKVYVFSGKTLKQATNNFTTFGVTITVAQADYQVNVDTAADPNFVGSLFGTPLARLGDFDGDGFDDFAVGSLFYNGRLGYMAVIYGGTRASVPMPSVITLPQAIGTRAQAILGDQTIGRFGWNILGLGKYYTGTPGTSLIVTAPRANAEAGRVYAFSGPLAGPTVTASSANHFVDGPAATSRIGYAMALLGNVSGTNNQDIALGMPSVNGGQGSALLYFGTPASGPFSGSPSVFTNSAASGFSDRFGFVVIGGGFSGTSVTTSFIGFGNGAPDMAFSSIWEVGLAPKLYIVDGMRAASSFDVSLPGGADVVYPLPADWVGTTWDNMAVKDLNGDGYGDLAIGEFLFQSPLPDGRLLVLW
jgi:hypothetical protein